MNRYVLTVALLLVAFPVFAQDWIPSGPPPVLAITTEMLKTGQATTHEKIESGWRRAFVKAQWPYHWLAASSLSGPDRMLFLTGYRSLVDWQADSDQQDALDWLRIEQEKLAIEDATYVVSKDHQLAIYVPELSRRNQDSLSRARYLLVTSIEVEPGQEQDLRKQMMEVIAAKGHAVNSGALATYRVLLGANETTFLVFEPLQSLQSPDHGLGSLAGNGAANAFGVPRGNVKRMQHDLMAFSPSMSYVSKEFAAGSPTFWRTD